MRKRLRLRKYLALCFVVVLALASPVAALRSSSAIPASALNAAVTAEVRIEIPINQPVPDATASVRATTNFAPAYAVDWSLVTTALAQGGLLGGYACAPTSLAMVTGFYSARHPVGTRSPAEYIANLRPGEFVPDQGVPYQKLARQITELGYRDVRGHMGSNQGELRSVLNSGPVIITAGGPVSGGQVSHSLVVTAISDDGRWVKLNDAADGRGHTISWERFDRLWAGGSRGILIITP